MADQAAPSAATKAETRPGASEELKQEIEDVFSKVSIARALGVP